MFQPDPVLPAIYFEAFQRKTALEPEKRLMLAVLEDAVECLRKNVRAKSSKGKTLFREAEDWILEERNDWLFSFDNVCEVLGLSPQRLRQGLMKAKERWRARSPRAKGPLAPGLTNRTRKRKRFRAAA